MIIRLAGGLGNQFFQYAFGRAYEEETGEKVCFDNWSFFRDKLRNYELDKYNIKKTSTNIIKQLVCNIVWEMKTHKIKTDWLEKIVGMDFEEELFSYQSNLKRKGYVVGFWQHEEYFIRHKDLIKKELQYNGKLTKIQKNIIEKMHDENSVAMHVRRTDYLTNNNLYECVKKDYYLSAIEFIREQLKKEIVIYVFSDDIEWCKETYAEVKNMIFIDKHISNNQHTDMEMMRNCQHFIIANSTFSWWAAWRSENVNKIVVCPQKWLVDNKMNERVLDALTKHCILI